MKKLIISGAVVLIFVAYGVYQRIASATNTSQNTTGTSTNTNTSSNNTTSAGSNSSTTSGSSSTNNSSASSSSGTTSSQYKNGTYTGNVSDAFYGSVQVQATIQGGKITNVEFLQYPNDRGQSIRINNQAMPLLKSEAITAQSSNVDLITGATYTSMAFMDSLSSALNQAQMS
jgi:uncharacterized protein with FMN-binding domain